VSDAGELARQLGELASSLGPAVRPVGSEAVLRSITETARQLFGVAACSPALLRVLDRDARRPEALHGLALLADVAEYAGRRSPRPRLDRRGATQPPHPRFTGCRA
jgi:hypothetical protein